ncbi:non-ribosomal peptide synthetase [Micromonospora humidisoli]|uniref:non-ribosomal peptide synthetase n=1 Tax=Micromonospora sp. AKA109 TaxID=2733865 RepID=UPI0024902BD1|nr:amino acid adenylation domain-containing protein [Micromonospora sp. AKA109]
MGQGRDIDQPMTWRLPIHLQALWRQLRLFPQSPAEHLFRGYVLSGPLDIERLRDAVGCVVRRHAILRTTFREHDDGTPVAMACDESVVDFAVINEAGSPRSTWQEILRRHAHQATWQPFNLDTEPLLRTRVVRLGTDRHGLLLIMHGLVADERSVDIICGEISTFYRAGTKRDVATLLPPPVQYAAVTLHPGTAAVPPRPAAPHQGQPWPAGTPEPVRLLADHRRRDIPDAAGRRRRFSVAHGTLTRLTAAAGPGIEPGAARPEDHDAVLLAVVCILLSRLNGQRDILLGYLVDGRNQAGDAPLIGRLAGPVPVRLDLSGVRRLADAVDLAADVLASRSTSAGVAAGSLSGAASETWPILPVTVDIAAERPHPIRLPGITVRPLDLDDVIARSELALTLRRGSHGVSGTIDYQAARFSDATVARWSGHLKTLIAKLTDDPRRPLDETSILSAAEHRRQITEWTATAREHPVQTVPELVALRTATCPDAIAVIDGREAMTYAQLAERARRLAGRLRTVGVGPDVPVAVCLPRTANLVVALLAVLQAGGAYVPVDTGYPVVRQEQILTDSGARAVITTVELDDHLPHPADRVVLHVDRDASADESPTVGDPGPHPDPANLAYILYTSGSTGRPKGVAVPHAGLSNLVAWHVERYGLTAGDHTTQVAAVGFDASVWEIWPTLTAGATLHIADDEHRLRPDLLLNWLARQRITVSFLPTPLADKVLRLPPPSGLALRALLVGGDVLRGRPRPDCGYTVVNHYGPTEASVVTTMAVVSPASAGTSPDRPPPIGRPIDNLRTYVLDDNLLPAPVGVPGELHIAGAGLARGYLGRPGHTAERFVPDPFSPVPGGRLYRTGDRVRYTPTGDIEFLGRLDHQIKLRGHRIEAAEVEVALRAHPGIEDAVVTPYEDEQGQTRLVGYITGPGAAGLATDTLREHLASRLPDYMIPSTFVPLDQLPNTAHGKIDRHSLPPVRTTTRTVRQHPRDAVEAVIAATWTQVLGQSGDIDVHDDFVALGGHSLLAGQVVSRVNAMFGVDLSIRALFDASTVETFATVVRQTGGADRVTDVARLIQQIDQLSDHDVARLLVEVGEDSGDANPIHHDGRA